MFYGKSVKELFQKQEARVTIYVPERKFIYGVIL